MLALLKLGGSLITDKLVEQSFRRDVMARLAAEVRAALDASPGLKLVIGHGSGSFGHFEAKRHGTMQGVSTPEQWAGFARVGLVAAELNRLVAVELVAAGLPVFRVQPSASARCEDGRLVEMRLDVVHRALSHGLVPLLYGDVAFDDVRGGTIISTEAIFTYLALNLPAEHVVLLGEVDGVYDEQGQIIPQITPGTLPRIQHLLQSSAGVDVTGGMLTKVEDMLALVQQRPGLSIQIANGLRSGVLCDALAGLPAGTLLRADT